MRFRRFIPGVAILMLLVAASNLGIILDDSNNIESMFKEISNELAPDPLNIDRLILNRLFHQTPDFPDKKIFN